eukprot:6212935-Pleurochrysis_carterae.AAC.1
METKIEVEGKLKPYLHKIVLIIGVRTCHLANITDAMRFTWFILCALWQQRLNISDIVIRPEVAAVASSIYFAFALCLRSRRRIHDTPKSCALVLTARFAYFDSLRARRQ